MKNLFKTVLLPIVVFVTLGVPSYAQEWTKDQKEVWQVVEDGWSKWKDKDWEGTFSIFHDQYIGWNSETPLPMDVAAVKKRWIASKDFMTVDYYEISPARIVVVNNTAVVHYYFHVEYTFSFGEKSEHEGFKGKNAEFYVKEKGDWKLLGDMTAEDKKDDN